MDSHSRGSRGLQRIESASRMLVFPELFSPTRTLINPRFSRRTFLSPRNPSIVKLSREYLGIVHAPRHGVATSPPVLTRYLWLGFLRPSGGITVQRTYPSHEPHRPRDRSSMTIEAVGGGPREPINESRPHLLVVVEDLEPHRPETPRKRSLQNTIPHVRSIVLFEEPARSLVPLPTPGDVSTNAGRGRCSPHGRVLCRGRSGRSFALQSHAERHSSPARDGAACRHRSRKREPCYHDQARNSRPD